MEEIWKPISNFKNKYAISNYGNLKNILTNTIYKNTNKYGDYFRIILYDLNKKKACYIHRLVAENFLPNPYNLKCVNHKDLNKQNNNVNNLEWCTYSYNVKHAIINGASNLYGIKKYNSNKFYKKYGNLYQYSLNGNLINIFNNLNEAYYKTRVCKRNILQCINYQQGRKQAGGFIWKSERR